MAPASAIGATAPHARSVTVTPITTARTLARVDLGDLAWDISTPPDLGPPAVSSGDSMRASRPRRPLATLALDLGEPDLDRRAAAGCTVNVDFAVGLPNDAEGHRELETGPRVDPGRQERVEEPFGNIGLDRSAGIGHRDHDHGPLAAVARSAARRDRQPAAIGHGVAGTQREAAKGLAEGVRIDAYEPRLDLVFELELYPRAKQRRQLALQTGDKCDDLDDLRLEPRLARRRSGAGGSSGSPGRRRR